MIGCFCTSKPGADFHFAAHAKRIDALVADGLRGMRPHNLPVIILRALIHCLYGLAIRRQAQQIELAIAAQVCGVKDERRRDWLLQQYKFLLLVAQPDHCAARVLAWSFRGWRNDQIKRPIVVEIGDPQPNFTGKIVGCVRNPGNFSRIPALSFVLVGNTNDGAVRLYHQQIENPIIIGVCHRHGFYRLQIGGQWTLAELALPLVHEHMKTAGCRRSSRRRDCRRRQDRPRQSRADRKLRQMAEWAKMCRPRYFSKPWAVPLLAPSTMSRSPSASMSTAHAPV